MEEYCEGKCNVRGGLVRGKAKWEEKSSEGGILKGGKCGWKGRGMEEGVYWRI